MDAELMAIPMTAASGAAISPMARSLSSAVRMLASISSAERSSGFVSRASSSGGRTRANLTRSHHVIAGTPDPSGVLPAGFEGTERWYSPTFGITFPEREITPDVPAWHGH